MNADNTADFERERLTVKKHLMAFEALRKLARRLMSAYSQLESESHDTNFWMDIREEELIFSRLLLYLFGFDVNASSCDLQEVIAMTAAIITDSNITLGEVSSAVH
jgi:hypothetical protein